VSPAQLTRATRAQAANNCGEDRIAYEFVSQARPTPAYCRDTGRGNSREGGGGVHPAPPPPPCTPPAAGSPATASHGRAVRREGRGVSD